jgi:subtilisin family serine protease
MKSGTSFAAPLVSGEAALLLTIAKDTNDNGLTNDEVRAAILNNTDAGRIDILKAVESLK